MNYTECEQEYYSQVFNRLCVCLEKGQGCHVWDTEGNKYLDFFAGIAVCSVGHCHPKVTETIKRQAEKLVHTSNWVYTKPQLELAEKINELSGLGKLFFTNSGSESVETAFKLARKVTGRKEVIACRDAFHGRTMGALSLTWKDNYKKPFEPLVPGTKFIEYNNPEALKEEITDDTAAFIVEPIQGEAGVLVPDDDYLKAVRDITEDHDVLLILDEVQTGFGRTGEWFAFQRENIKPDVLCLAKGLGGGFPIGATVFAEGLDFDKSQQGSTFPGSPLACATAKSVIDVIEEENLLENALKQGEAIRDGLTDLDLDSRGRGLMIAFEAEGKDTVLKLIDKNVLTINAADAVRVLPPLNISSSDVNKFLDSVREVINEDG